MKRLAIFAIASLLSVGAPSVGAAQTPVRLLAVVAVDGLSGGVTFPPGWRKLFDVEDAATKQISCSAAWRDSRPGGLPPSDGAAPQCNAANHF
jgi:hypothetical protein